MELDDEYFQTIFETPLQTKEFVEVMSRLEKAAMDDKAKKSMEFALRLLDAHNDVPEIAAIVDKIKAALGGGGAASAGGNGSTYPAPGAPGYGTPGSAGKEDKTVEKKDLKKEETTDKDKLLIKVDDPAAQAQLEAFWKEKEEQGKMLKQANEEIETLKKAEELRGYMAKAAEFNTLPQDGLAQHLMDIGALGEEALKRELSILEMANEANKRGKIMEEIGTSDVPQGVAADVEKGAKALMAKSKDLTEAAARVQFAKENPDVYERLDKERMARGS